MRPFWIALALLWSAEEATLRACTLEEGPPSDGAMNLRRVFSPDCSDAERSVPAAELISALREGKVVRVQRGRIDGAVDLPSAATEGALAGSVMLLDSEVVGEIRGEQVEFLGDMIFWNTVFDGAARFNAARFSHFADFRGALFRREAQFRDVRFAGATGFIRVAFGGLADFSGTLFEHPAGFGRSTFAGGVNFDGAQFRDHADFSWDSFAEASVFRGASFAQSADFSQATFAGPVDFGESEFSKRVSFRSAAFRSELSFEGALFHAGFSALGVRYRGFESMAALLLGVCGLSLFVQGTAMTLTRGCEGYRVLLSDPAFLVLAAAHLGIVLGFYFSPLLLPHLPSRRELIVELLGLYSALAASVYPVFLFASSAQSRTCLPPH